MHYGSGRGTEDPWQHHVREVEEMLWYGEGGNEGDGRDTLGALETPKLACQPRTERQAGRANEVTTPLAMGANFWS